MKFLKAKLTFNEEVLGMSPSNPDLYREYIASKAPNPTTVEDEIEAIGVEGVVEKAKTIFPRNKDGKPCIFNYQLKGYLKGAAGFMRTASGSLSKTVKNYKKRINGNFFIIERMIPFEDYDEIGECPRPLRADTPQGERNALANSETIPAGATLTFTIVCLNNDDIKVLKEWLDFGFMSGIGQWRNSGKGVFDWEELPFGEEDFNNLPPDWKKMAETLGWK